MTELFVAFLAGLALGGLIAWLAGRAGRARLEGEVARERQRADDARRLFDEAGMRLREAFQKLSDEALGRWREHAAGDLAARHKAIEQLVKPVGDSLEGVERYLREVEKQRVGAYEGLREHLDLMKAAQADLRRETANLVKALRAPSVRGRWGEIQLERVVELAGMVEHCDFTAQETVTTEDGRLRPDVVVKLPGGKTIVVDAKAPIEAYLEAVEAVDDAEREARLKDHARQVREHITRLSSKGYWEQFDASPEFVVMFLPGETFFSAALNHDPALIEYGVEQRVIPASPTTLIALLRAVAYGWRQERLAANAQAISELGRELYDRIRVWAEHLARLGKELDGAVDAYNDAIGSLQHRVLVSARRFEELGAVSEAALPEVGEVERGVRGIEAGDREPLEGET